jgi:hypothetical protein
MMTLLLAALATLVILPIGKDALKALIAVAAVCVRTGRNASQLGNL